MEWVRENWVFIIVFIIFIAMHLFGHGCMPGGHRRHKEEEEHKEHEGRSSSEEKGGHGCC